jgi:hypothetical protein
MDTLLEMLARRGEHLLGRASGPLNFRLVIMPLIITILAIRAHLRVVREGEADLLGAFFTSPTERRRLLRSGLKDFGKVFIVALRARHHVPDFGLAVVLPWGGTGRGCDVRHRAVYSNPRPGHAHRALAAPKMGRAACRDHTGDERPPGELRPCHCFAAIFRP